KEALTKCFADILACGLPLTLGPSGSTNSIIAFRFPGGGSVSFEFSTDALHERELRRGAWLEVRTDDIDALRQRIVDAGLEQVKHAATRTFYFVVPGGQVIGLASVDQ